MNTTTAFKPNFLKLDLDCIRYLAIFRVALSFLLNLSMIKALEC